MLRDLVLIKPMPLHIAKTKDGIIIPGDVDKMAPKRATVVAAGPGIYVKTQFVPNPFKPGDQVLYMERDLIPAKIEGDDYTIIKSQDIIVKIGFQDPGPNETLPEMTEGAYFAETVRRAVIARLKACGLERVQDMINPVENFVTSDGETVVATARSFMVESEKTLEDWNPPEDAKAFSMYMVNFLELESRPEINQETMQPTGAVAVVRLAFLPRTDVTLG